MSDTIRRLTQPNPPMCDFCREPAVLKVQHSVILVHVYCNKCWKKRRQKEGKE